MKIIFKRWWLKNECLWLVAKLGWLLTEDTPQIALIISSVRPSWLLYPTKIASRTRRMYKMLKLLKW